MSPDSPRSPAVRRRKTITRSDRSPSPPPRKSTNTITTNTPTGNGGFDPLLHSLAKTNINAIEANSLRGWKTINLKSGDPNLRRRQIREYFHATFTTFERLHEMYNYVEALFLTHDPAHPAPIVGLCHSAAFYINRSTKLGVLRSGIDSVLEAWQRECEAGNYISSTATQLSAKARSVASMKSRAMLSRSVSPEPLPRSCSTLPLRQRSRSPAARFLESSPPVKEILGSSPFGSPVLRSRSPGSGRSPCSPESSIVRFSFHNCRSDF